jgi:phosphoadenylyl-sulfate reductase (thioredoxin)
MTDTSTPDNPNSFGSHSATVAALGHVFEGGVELADRVFQPSAPADLLRAACQHFGDGLVLTTAFGLEGSVLVDLIGRHRLPIRIVTLDTGLFFERTRDTWAALEHRYGLTIEAIHPAQSLAEQAAAHGPELWRRAPDRCCDLRKVQPLRSVLAQATGWISGVRRDQTPERAQTPKVGFEPRFGVVKLAPLADWSARRVRQYLEANQVPYNPMFDDGYPSVGCHPCTSRVAPGEDVRAGRWRGLAKRECGLHWATRGEDA